jgi:hypothetical protein
MTDLLTNSEVASILGDLNTLVLRVNNLSNNIIVTDTTAKDNGFSLSKKWYDKDHFAYEVKYRDSHTGKWIYTRTNTHTDNWEEANIFAIREKDKILRNFFARKEQRKNSGIGFYSMLLEYYADDSKYLNNDTLNEKRELNPKQIVRNRNFIKKHLIPFLKNQKVVDFDGFTREVYNSLKDYLKKQKTSKGEVFSDNYINHHLTCVNRILQYAERKEMIAKLPYSPGSGKVKVNSKKKRGLLPTEYLDQIFSLHIKSLDIEGMYFYLVCAITLCFGLRNSELARIKREDVKYVKKCDAYYIKVWNHKTEFHNKTEAEGYRKMPLHKFLIDALMLYCKIKNIQKNDYIFGSIDKNGEPQLPQKISDKAIKIFYTQICIKRALPNSEIKIIPVDNAEYDNRVKENEDSIANEMKEKNIVFYSFRDTFESLLGIQNPSQTLLIDYFMGHKPEQEMLANYLNINGVDNEKFFFNFGNHLLKYQEQFLPNDETIKNALQVENIIKDFTDSEGKIDNEGILNYWNTLIRNIPKKVIESPTDEYFESV